MLQLAQRQLSPVQLLAARAASGLTQLHTSATLYKVAEVRRGFDSLQLAALSIICRHARTPGRVTAVMPYWLVLILLHCSRAAVTPQPPGCCAGPASCCVLLGQSWQRTTLSPEPYASAYKREEHHHK